MDRGETLFAKYDIGSTLRNGPARLVQSIDALSDAEILDGGQEKLVQRLVVDHLIAIPELHLDAVEPSQCEVDIDVSGDQTRMIYDRSRPSYIKGTEISFRVPFTGDPDVFRCQPSSYSLNPPHADIERDAIIVRVVRQDQNPQEFRKVFDYAINQINSALAQLRLDCAGLEKALQNAASARLIQRREKRQKDRELIDQLGFSQRKPSSK